MLKAGRKIYFLGTLFFLLSVQVFAAADVKGKGSEQETVVVEASDLEDFAKAAAQTEEEKTGRIKDGEEDFFNSKRLLVKGSKKFDTMGAESIISGYENLFVLDYASVKETKKAYSALQKIKGLTVETDISYEGTAKTERSGGKTNGEYHAEVSASEGFDAKENLKSRDIYVAVLDSGYDKESYGEKRIRGGADLTGSGTVMDENGHGTAMSGIILENTPECVKVMPVKTADDTGRTSSLKLYMGICYAIEQKADIINISMSAYQASGSRLIQEAVKEAHRAGIAVVVSAGNAGGNIADFSPANVEEAIVVSALGPNGSIAEYSNRGKGVDFCSYGSIEIQSAGGKTLKQEGTSVAAAIVSAAAAEKKAYQNTASYEEFLALLNADAVDMGETGKDALYGNGFLAPKSVRAPEHIGAGKEENLLVCDWKAISIEELNGYIGLADNLERRIFLERLSSEEREFLLSKNTIFSETVIYSENSFDAEGNTRETLHKEGKLYDIVMSCELPDEYRIQAQKYHVFAYGSNHGTRSCIQLDTIANQNKAVVYCWMKDLSTDQNNTGEYGLLYAAGRSAYDFGDCESGIENCDKADSGNPVVWRLKIKNLKVNKPKNMAVNWNRNLWTKEDTASGFKKNYWYIFEYQVKPASNQTKQNAYANGAYHGGFWDLEDASGKKCGNSTVTTTVDIGSLDLFAGEGKEGIVYRLPLAEHAAVSSAQIITDAEASCTQKGKRHIRTSYACSVCGKGWTSDGEAQELPQLFHLFAAKVADDNGIENGKYWEECTRLCGGSDAGGTFWQKNIQYLQPIRCWEMNVDGSYSAGPSKVERQGDYYAVNTVVPRFEYTPSEEFLTGVIESFQAPASASYHDLYISRKKYKIRFDGNGAQTGKMPDQKFYCGQIFNLPKCSFNRRGYKFLGWSLEPDGKILKPFGVKNLSLQNNAVVTLYAKWVPGIFEIMLDNCDADENAGTQTVYEKYTLGYYKDASCQQEFSKGKIKIPKKTIADPTLLDGVRRQMFTGYYTKPEGKGDLMIQKDGSLIADINGAGDYRYFFKDSVVYANWENMYAVQFDPNLSKGDLKLLGTDETGAVVLKPVICPQTRFKAKNESITVSYGEASVRNKQFASVYRFLGWSLTPEIKSRDEIVLSRDKRACTFSDERDVTLYAQWDTGFTVAYMGNDSSDGTDFYDRAEKLTEDYTFAPNSFKKEELKPSIHIATGETKNETGDRYTENMPYSFQGWSMEKEKEKQDKGDVFLPEEKTAGSRIFLAAQKLAEESGRGLTFGKPSSDFKESGNVERLEETTPVINLYAVWDAYPQIYASDLYLPFSDAKEGRVTEEYLLELASASDEELISETNPDGKLKNGIDEENKTSFAVSDYQSSDFTGADEDMSLTITYRAEDKTGNCTYKMVKVFLVDTSGQEYDTGSVRFISAEYLDTLAEDSIWRTDEYAEILKRALGNQKNGEEYTSVTPFQKALGIKPVKKPESGVWEHVQEIWEFRHEDVQKIQTYAEQERFDSRPLEFLGKFGRCRVK